MALTTDQALTIARAVLRAATDRLDSALPPCVTLEESQDLIGNWPLTGKGPHNIGPYPWGILEQASATLVEAGLSRMPLGDTTHWLVRAFAPWIHARHADPKAIPTSLAAEQVARDYAVSELFPRR